MPRQTYTVDFPDGHSQTFEGPPGMSDADLVQRAQQERKFAGGDIATSFAGGATRHLLEDEPGAVNALLGGAATATGLAPVMAAVPAATRGLKALSQLIATGRADPTSPGELAGIAAEGAAMGYGGQALAAGARKVGLTKDAIVGGLPKWVRALGIARLNPKTMLLDAATSKPALGAIEALGEGLTPSGARDAFVNVAKGMRPGYEAADELAPAAAKTFRQTTSSVDPVPGSWGPNGSARAARNASYPKWLADMGDEATAAAPRPALSTTAGRPVTPATGDPYPQWNDVGDVASGTAVPDALTTTAGRASTAAPSTSWQGWPAPAARSAPAVAAPAAAPAAEPLISAADRARLAAQYPAGTIAKLEAQLAADAAPAAAAPAIATPTPAPVIEPPPIRPPWLTKATQNLRDLEGAAATRTAPKPDILDDFQIVDDALGPNASGESGASLEALSRQRGMAGRGEQHVVYDRAGVRRPLIGPEAVDYVPARGESFGIEGPSGFRMLTDKGGRPSLNRAGQSVGRYDPESASGWNALAKTTDDELTGMLDEPELIDLVQAERARRGGPALQQLMDTPSFRSLRKAGGL